MDDWYDPRLIAEEMGGHGDEPLGAIHYLQIELGEFARIIVLGEDGKPISEHTFKSHEPDGTLEVMKSGK